MEITPKTKISTMLAEHPFLQDFLEKLNPHFSALSNPVMRNTIGKIATLSQVALMGGTDLKGLMDAIAGEIKRQTGTSPVVRHEDTGKPTDERQEILKGIIKDLHAGIDVNTLKQRFSLLIKDVAPWEIGQMEQQLIAEGMPAEEVKRLCDVHVSVFKEALENKTVPGLPAGHPVHTLMTENRALEDIIAQIEELTDISKLPVFLKIISQIDKHYLRKENQLFPILEQRGVAGPSKVMWAVHDDIRAALKELKAAVPARSEKLTAFIQSLRDMIYKEEHILYPMALEILSEEEWFKVKLGEEEIGYAWISPTDKWGPTEMAARHESVSAERVGSLNLDTGILSAEQINLLLTHLPVDISFVNEKDEVLYYSQTKERIFPRSPGVIGRTVQNCHPPKSVDTVQTILDSFRAGTKDSAEFWIQMKGRFLHIRYFAVRDAGGKYRGCLEVSQDVTDIRALTGERRLLHWD